MYSQRAPAKINLGLQVLRQRPDGYHDVESVLLPIAWSDRITVRPAETITMTCTDSTRPTDDRNLCLRAAHRLAAETGVSTGADIHLEKQIPYGAGLGGGSSDAAITLRLLARLWNLSWEPERLQEVARHVGSDVPFFIEARPASIHGRGTDVRPLGESYHFPYTLVVAKPPVSMSTAEAYQLVTPRLDGRTELRELVASNDLRRWRNELSNDFERPVFEKLPEIAGLKRWFQNHEAAYASLSGSGTAVYGVYADEAAAREAARILRSREGFQVYIDD
jgi:4-diphosphocytidyl-2-C-methyl-D-erythritol kinase